MFKIRSDIIVIQAEAVKPISTGVVFWSHDRGTAKLIFELQKDDINQSLATGTIVPIVLEFDSITAENGRGKHTYFATIEDAINGIVSIVLEDNILGYQGRVNGSIYIELPDSRSLDTAGRFTFDIKRSPIDEDMPELEDYYWQGFNDIMEQYHESIAKIRSEAEKTLDRLASDIGSAQNELTNLDTRVDEISKKIDDNDVVNKVELPEYIETYLKENLATQAEAEAGLTKDKLMTPFLVFKAIAKWVQGKFVTPEDLLNKTYPIGSIYPSVSSVNPELLFGGTWERFAKGQVLVGVDETDADFAAGKAGGSKAHKLTINELPKHTVPLGLNKGSNPSVSGTGTSGYLWGDVASGGKNSGSVGDDQPHNNLQPYIAVYMWKRIA